MASMKTAHILQLADDLEIVGQLEEAVVVIRRGQRWLQDRHADRKWDSFEDDREYDPPGVGRDDDGNAIEIGPDGEDVETHSMDTAFRHRLAMLRLKLGDDEQAMVSHPCYTPRLIARSMLAKCSRSTYWKITT